MLVRSKVEKKIPAFVTYLDDENKDVILHYPLLERGRVVPLPFHLFVLFQSKGLVSAENKRKAEKEETNKEENHYSGFSV